MSGFIFRGTHSSVYGIHTVDQSRTILPPRREGKIAIPGRSGYYDGVSGGVDIAHRRRAWGRVIGRSPEKLPAPLSHLYAILP